MTIKVSVICSSKSTLATLETHDPALAEMEITTHAGSAEMLAGVLQNEQPDVVLADFPVDDEQTMEQVETALTRAPGTHMVLVSPDRSAEFLMRAMRVGVRQVLPPPMNSMTVQQAVQHVQKRSITRAFPRDGVGRILAVIPSKGGAGATFLATNLAYALSIHGKRVAVIDLNLYFGDAAIFLGNSNVTSNVVDLARQMQRLDSALLASSMIKTGTNLHVLAAPESPVDVDEVSTEGVEKILELARGQYDFVILDVGSAIDPVAIKALDLADSIYITLQLNLPFLRAAKRMASLFQELGYSSGKLKVVVNRYEKGSAIDLTDVEKATLLRVYRTIPNSHAAVDASINQGIPLVEMAPRNPVALALDEWAQELAPLPVQSSRRGWLGGFMKPASST